MMLKGGVGSVRKQFDATSPTLSVSFAWQRILCPRTELCYTTDTYKLRYSTTLHSKSSCVYLFSRTVFRYIYLQSSLFLLSHLKSQCESLTAAITQVGPVVEELNQTAQQILLQKGASDRHERSLRVLCAFCLCGLLIFLCVSR